MRFSRISRVVRVSRTRKVWVSAVAATAVAGTALTAVLITGSGDDSDGAGSRADSADEDRRTAMALTRFRTSTAAGPSEVTVRLPSAGTGTVTVRAVADHRLHRAVGVYEVTDDGHIMRGLLAWDLEGIAVAGSPASATDNSLATKARPAAPGPVTTAVQAARRAGTLKSGQWTRRPYGTAPLDQALRVALSVGADGRASGRLPAASQRLAPRSPGGDTVARPTPSALAQTYSLDADGDLRRITAEVAPGQKATVDFAATRARAGVPGAPWE
ncbi:hypothetical protein ACFYPC_12600 [Streptomyces sp. NPDC005808]|uniref:hypothetical protein n=1 Tax=Streptomyces sp. NPDC005808 TaxID=3364734 RepID=UPI0036A9B1ED